MQGRNTTTNKTRNEDREEGWGKSRPLTHPKPRAENPRTSEKAGIALKKGATRKVPLTELSKKQMAVKEAVITNEGGKRPKKTDWVVVTNRKTWPQKTWWGLGFCQLPNISKNFGWGLHCEDVTQPASKQPRTLKNKGKQIEEWTSASHRAGGEHQNLQGPVLKGRTYQTDTFSPLKWARKSKTQKPAKTLFADNHFWRWGETHFGDRNTERAEGLPVTETAQKSKIEQELKNNNLGHF